MRIIAGQYRSRILSSPPGDATRPTSDRLRETLFNIMAARMQGCRFVDLYAGTGAVGLEAISRGATHTWFSENAIPALKSLRANLAALKIPTAAYTLEDRGTTQLLQRLPKLLQGNTADIIYLDPPYDLEDAYTQTLGFLGSSANRALLAEDALVIAEHATKSKFQLSDRYGALTRTRVYKQGDASLSFYSKGAP